MLANMRAGAPFIETSAARDVGAITALVGVI